ncbi:MAG TPA: EAL domain-containing protein, partial [Azospira sp.]|nr:EAL domain-containing protein [Azospira sp.]
HERDPGIRAALLYFDLDEFKTVNDSFGHRAGDAVLLRVAGDVGQLLRGNEIFARLGGDEFAVIAPGADLPGVQALAQRIIAAVAALGFEFEGTKVRLTSSLGIALLPDHARRPEEWVTRADIAMYAAKHAGKNGWRVYREELAQSAYLLTQLSWAERIQAALERNLFELHFQGIYTTGTPVLSHLEVLLRMRDPENQESYLMPGEFIPAAERNGRILDIDRWVLAAGIRLLGQRADLPDLAINISGRSFDDPGLPDFITGLLHTHGVAPQRLLVELTETAALSNMADTQRFISHVRDMGGSVCLDDFGVGFSSFAYLKHLDADVIKIDGMFIRNLVSSREDQVFVRAIIEVARGLGKKTVAEFVEDAATYELLGQLGVDLAQGYYLCRPQAQPPPREQPALCVTAA